MLSRPLGPDFSILKSPDEIERLGHPDEVI